MIRKAGSCIPVYNTMYFNTDWHIRFTARLFTSNHSSHSVIRDRHIPGLNSYKDIQNAKILGHNRSYVRNITNLCRAPLHNNKVNTGKTVLSVLSNRKMKMDDMWRGFSRLDFRNYSSADLSDDVHKGDNVENMVVKDATRTRSISSSMFLIQDEKWAKAVVRILKTHINFNNKQMTIVECNPDCGVLTRALLRRTKVNVLSVEFRNIQIQDNFQALLNKRSSKNRLYFEKGSIIDLRTMLRKIGKLDDTLKPTGRKIKIIGTTFPGRMYAHFIRLLTYDLGAENLIYSLGPVEFFLFVNSSELQLFSEKRRGRLFKSGILRSALYRIFFQVNVLLKIPYEAFGAQTKQKKNYDPDIYLIRLVPQNLDKICAKQDIPRLVSLLKEIRKRRTQTVISAVESICTATSYNLKKDGFNPSRKICDLSVKEVLQIHKLLLANPDSLPNFGIHEEDTYDQELTNTYDDDTDVDVDDDTNVDDADNDTFDTDYIGANDDDNLLYSY